MSLHAEHLYHTCEALGPAPARQRESKVTAPSFLSAAIMQAFHRHWHLVLRFLCLTPTFLTPWLFRPCLACQCCSWCGLCSLLDWAVLQILSCKCSFCLRTKKFQMFCKFCFSLCVLFLHFFLLLLLFCFLNCDFGKANFLTLKCSFPGFFLWFLAFCNLFKKSVYSGVICFFLEVHWF